MRAFFYLLLILTATAMGAFYMNPGMRDVIRGWTVSDKDQETFDAYRQGKALFISEWPGGPLPQFSAWGDNRAENAHNVAGDIWFTHGYFRRDMGGSSVTVPWCILFVVDQGTTMLRETGDNALAASRLIQAGQYQAAVAKYSHTAHPGAPAPAPPPRGAWMWEGNSPLDRRPGDGKR